MFPPFQANAIRQLLAGSYKGSLVVGELAVVGACNLDTNAPSCGEFFLEFTYSLVAAHGEFATLCTLSAEGSESCIFIGHSALAGNALVNTQGAAEVLLEVGLEGLYLHAAVNFEFCHNDFGFRWLIYKRIKRLVK